MLLNKIHDITSYQEIVDRYKRKGCRTNDYIYNEAFKLIEQGCLFYHCGFSNAYFFVKKDGCQRVFYYLNDLEEKCNFDVEDDLVVEILFRESFGMPDEEIGFLQNCGFLPHLRRDQYCGIYKDLTSPQHIPNVIVRKAQTLDEVLMACDLFNNTFDRYTGDYIAEQKAFSLYDNGDVWIATDNNGRFAGALHQTNEHNVSWISHVAVLPAFRGRGLGQALLDTFVEQNKVDDKSSYMLWVQAQNESALTMYQKKGFKYMNKSTISLLKLKK